MSEATVLAMGVKALESVINPRYAPGVLLIVLAAGLEGVAQVCLKRSANAPRPQGHYWLAAGVALFAFEIGAYTRALKSLDVTLAYPLSALSYVAVALAARVLLKERPSRRHWLGLVFIMLGAAFSIPEN